jgi:hypothetical protein
MRERKLEDQLQKVERVEGFFPNGLGEHYLYQIMAAVLDIKDDVRAIRTAVERQVALGEAKIEIELDTRLGEALSNWGALTEPAAEPKNPPTTPVADALPADGDPPSSGEQGEGAGVVAPEGSDQPEGLTAAPATEVDLSAQTAPKKAAKSKGGK